MLYFTEVVRAIYINQYISHMKGQFNNFCLNMMNYFIIKNTEIKPILNDYSSRMIEMSTNLYNDANNYYENNFNTIIFVLLLMIIALLFIIVDYQIYNKNLIKIMYLMDKEKLNNRVKLLEKNNNKLLLDNDKMTRIINLYKDIKTSNFGYFKMIGDQSDRYFRNEMRGVKSEYLGKNVYLVPLKYLNKYINMYEVLNNN